MARMFPHFLLAGRWPPASGGVFRTTVQSFKGLKSPIVIPAGLEEYIPT